MVEREVRAGKFIECPWPLFKLAYFPALGDVEAADLLGDWCLRHRIEPMVREVRAEAGGRLHPVVYIELKARR